MKEYYFENGHKIDLDKLKSEKLPLEDYVKSNKGLVTACHDVFIEYHNGILLVIRDNFPAKGILWSIGGRIERGMTTEDSLIKKVKEECNLELENTIEIGHARTFWETDPFNHNKGTDTINIVYFGSGKGELKLDNLHKNPTIVLPGEYLQLRNELHPYVQDFMDIAIKLIK